MQFLKLGIASKLPDLIKAVGSKNVDSILSYNGLTRSPSVGAALASKNAEAASSTQNVSWQNKSTILNKFTGDADVFEQAALSSEDDWKIISATGALPGTLRIPESVVLADSVDITGGSGVGVTTLVYKRVMDSLKSGDHQIDTSVFNDYSTMPHVDIEERRKQTSDTSSVFTAFNLPWGKITLWSSLANESIDIPVYPEEISDSRKASYTTMPDTLFQYEPWYTYENSGPRANSYTFKMHRDMWSGNHLDGNANKLIRFCEANCYPAYDGSAVNTATVTLYINGRPHISGILTEVSTSWSGPIGQDGWYLNVEMQLSITEVSSSPINYNTMRNTSLIGGQSEDTGYTRTV